jgi:hypothetical protein
MKLSEKRSLFTKMVAELILEALRQGFQPALGEAFRPPETAKQYALEGRGISNSLHTVGLAVDLILYRNGTYLTKSEDYLPLGVWWESQGGAWGGRFSKPDGNHFSLAHEGRR